MKKLMGLFYFALLLFSSLSAWENVEDIVNQVQEEPLVHVPIEGRKSFYQVQSLDELIENRRWLQDEDVQLSYHGAREIYQCCVPLKIKTICEVFGNKQLRQNRSFNHIIILNSELGNSASICGFAIGKSFGCRTILVPAHDLAEDGKSGVEYLSHLLHLAKKVSEEPEAKPIVVIIDEFNALMERHRRSNGEQGMLKDFYIAIDLLIRSNVLVVLTTDGTKGYPDHFLRRFDGYMCTISNPPREVRAVIIGQLLQEPTYALDPEVGDSEWRDFLLDLTDSFDWREIGELLFCAQQICLVNTYNEFERPDPEHLIYKKDFKDAVKLIRAKRPSKIFKLINNATEFCKNHQKVILGGAAIGGLAIITSSMIWK